MPNLFVVVDVTTSSIPVAREWLKSLRENTVVLTKAYESIAHEDFECDAFTDRDIIATNSDLEELAYKNLTLYRQRLVANPAYPAYRGVPVFGDIHHCFSIRPELFAIWIHCFAHLKKLGYANIVFCIEHHSYFDSFLLDCASIIGINSSQDHLLRIVNDRVESAVSNKADDGRFSRYSVYYLRKFLHQAFAGLRVPAAAENLQNSGIEIGANTPSVAARTNSTPKPLVFILSTGSNYLRHALPILQAFRKRREDLEVICLDQFQVEALGRLDIAATAINKYVSLSRLARLRISLTAFRLYVALRAVTKSELRTNFGNPVQDEMAFRQISFLLFHGEISHNGFSWLKLESYLTTIAHLVALIEVGKPDVIYRLPMCGGPIDYALFYLARSRNIRLVSSVVMSLDSSYRNLDRAPQDILTVLGESQVKVIREADIARHVIAVGQPELDTVIEWTQTRAESYVRTKAREIPSGARILVVATSTFDQQNELIWIRRLAELASYRADYWVILKLHPSIRREPYDGLFDKANKLPVSLIEDQELIPYVKVAEIVFTDVSHAGMIAAYLGKKLVAVNLSGKSFPYHRFDEEGVALGVTSLNGLEGVFSYDWSNPGAEISRQRFVRRYFTYNDGKASDRIADVVFSISRAQSRKSKCQIT